MNTTVKILCKLDGIFSTELLKIKSVRWGWASEMVHWVKVLACRPDVTNSTPGSHRVEMENQFDPHKRGHTHTHKNE